MTTSEPIISSTVETWCGSAEIWTADTYHLAIRRSARLAVEVGTIIVRLPKKEIRFSPDDIVEARTFRFPVPSMTLVFSVGEQHALVSLFRFPSRLQEQFLEQTELQNVDRRTWRTGLEAGRDKRKYSLQSGRAKS